MKTDEKPDIDALVRQYRESGSIASRDRAVAACLPIAKIVARRFSGRGVEYDDLYQVASLALFKALERFDVGKGVKFMSFATPTMVGEVKNFFRDRSRLIRIPRRSGELLRSIEQAREALNQRLERSPTAEEIARELGVDLEEVLETIEMGGALRLASLDGAANATDDGEDFSLHATLGYEEEGYRQIETRDLVARAMDLLSEVERQVLTGLFFDGRSQRDIAQELGVSQMTVSRIERKALLRARASLVGEGM